MDFVYYFSTTPKSYNIFQISIILANASIVFFIKIIKNFLNFYWTNDYDKDSFFDWLKSWLDLEEKGQKLTMSKVLDQYSSSHTYRFDDIAS